MDSTLHCPCSSGKAYIDCCQPFHEGVLPSNALELMRSRFSAYAMQLPDYIIATTHPASSQFSENTFVWRNQILNFSKYTQFQKLTIHQFSEFENFGLVTFTAHILQNQQDATFTEKSIFEKLGKKWFYRNGQGAKGEALNLIDDAPFHPLPLIYYGNPILRKKGELISKIDTDLHNLIERMVYTMDISQGIGIAAPQINQSLKLFIIRKPTEIAKDQYQFNDVEVFINPKLRNPSKNKIKRSEGCLSIPTIRCEVERPSEITVDYINFHGEETTLEASGMLARMIMHENDHVNGVLFTDRLDKAEKKKIENQLHHLEKRLSKY